MFQRSLRTLEYLGFLYIFLCERIHIINSETLHVSQREGYIAILNCGTLTKGKVTWSRDIDGQRVDILTNHNGEMTKLISDPDRRYSSGGNLVLSISRVSQSDAGRYYCSGTTVELTVKPKYMTPSVKPKVISGKSVVLKVVFGIVTGSWLISVVLSLFLCRLFSRMKAQRDLQRPYANVCEATKTT